MSRVLLHTGQHLVDIDGLREKLQCLGHWRPDSVFLRRSSSHVRSETPRLKELC